MDQLTGRSGGEFHRAVHGPAAGCGCKVIIDHPLQSTRSLALSVTDERTRIIEILLFSPYFFVCLSSEFAESYRYYIVVLLFSHVLLVADFRIKKNIFNFSVFGSNRMYQVDDACMQYLYYCFLFMLIYRALDEDE